MTFTTAVRKAHEYGELLVLSIKSNGGYKFRQMLKLSDKEVQRMADTCENAVRDLVIRITVAELMLQEPPRSYHSRWGEYQGKLTDAKQLIVDQQRKSQRRRKTA